jgi:hypothetical protein
MRCGDDIGSEYQVRIILIFIIIFLYPFQSLAKREHPEKWYQERWCKENNGHVEVALPDGTRHNLLDFRFCFRNSDLSPFSSEFLSLHLKQEFILCF